jgi:DNA-binding NarL/FixJ family response regulator
MKIRVLIADDHTRFREALRRMLTAEEGIEVVAEVANGDEVVECSTRTAPDVVCMDYRMPGLNGIDATRQLVAACPGIKVIGLSANSERHFALEMCKAGAIGYVAKNDVGAELIRVIRDAVGRPYEQEDAATTEMAPLLTLREREILKRLVDGFTEPEIAEQLSLAPALVNVHLRNTMRKLNVPSIAELLRLVDRNAS